MNTESKKAARVIELLTVEDAFDLMQVNQSLRCEVQERKKMEKRLRKYQKELRLLTSELSLSEERQRRNIAYELHERLGQGLAMAKIKINTLIPKAPDSEFERELRDIFQLVDSAITDTRLLTRELSPPVLHQFGFSAAVEWLAEELKNRYGVEITVEQAEIERLNIDCEVLLFQVTRELLINVVRHAKATRCKVIVIENNRSLRIIVKDNGRGFVYKPSNLKKVNGFGLFGVGERIKHLGGCFRVESRRGFGSSISVVVPRARLMRVSPLPVAN